MKLLHISDLHIGKRVNGFSMTDDQRYILDELYGIAAKHCVDGVIIAGDVYDKTVPTTEAVGILDDFITRLAQRKINVFIVSGNHDSAERLCFGNRIMSDSRIYIAGEFDGSIPKISLTDSFGRLNIYLASYLKPSVVNRRLKAQAEGFDDCMRLVMNKLEIDKNDRNLLVAHQFVTTNGKAPESSDSETKFLGGTENIDVTVFDSFDYVALGHLHGPQKIGRDTVRYSGSPIKYSFSECRHIKSAVLVELREKGNIKIQKIPLTPKREMKTLRASLAQIQNGETLRSASPNDYVHITLTDEGGIYDAIGKIRAVYPNVMGLEFDNTHSAQNSGRLFVDRASIKYKNPQELFCEFYEIQNNECVNDFQHELLTKIFCGAEVDTD